MDAGGVAVGRSSVQGAPKSRKKKKIPPPLLHWRDSAREVALERNEAATARAHVGSLALSAAACVCI